jgi:hypothetical protein
VVASYTPDNNAVQAFNRTAAALPLTATVASRIREQESEERFPTRDTLMLSSPGLTGRSSNHRLRILDCPVKPGNDTLGSA